MHPVPLDDGEIALLKEARESRDWSILPTFKLKYVYQRLVAFPRSDITAVKEIAELARKKWRGEDQEMLSEAEKVFGE